MKRAWFHRLKWAALGLLLGLPALWIVVLTVAPTRWARTRLETRIHAATGHQVRIERVHLGILGGLRLRGLTLSAPNHPDDPWLRASEVTIDLNPLHLLGNHGEPTQVEAKGLILRARREPGGAFEFCPLLRTGPRSTGLIGGRSDSDDDRTVAFHLVDGQVSVIDEPSGTRLELTELEGLGTWTKHHSRLEQLHGKLNGGFLDLTVDLERSTTGPMFEAELRGRDIELNSGSGLLALVLPMLIKKGQTADLNGQLDLNLYLRGQGDTCSEVLRTLQGQGAIRLDPITLADAGLLAELAKALALPNGARLAAVHGPFVIGRSRLASQALVLDVGSLPIALDGWTDFQGRFDYRVRSEALTSMLVPEIRSAIPDLPATLDDALDLRLRGGDHPTQILAAGVPLGKDASGHAPTSRELLRDVAKRLRDRITR